MKKYLAVLMVAALMLSVFTGCGGNQAGGSSSSDSSSPSATSVEPVKITLAHVEAETTSLGLAATAFKDYVEKASNGTMTVNILPNGQIGGDKEAAEACALGTIQMSANVTSVLTEYSDNFMILDLPFMFNSRQTSYDALAGDLGAALNKDLEGIGVINLGYNDNGLREITNNVKPINTPADLKGIKMRVMESPAYIEMFKLLGANPVPMSFTEVYTGLQQGTVDAQENGVSLIFESKFQEVQKYLSMTNHVYSFNSILVNEKFYNSLTPDQQKIITDGVKEKLIDYKNQTANQMDDKAIQELKAAGMVVNEITPENMQLFRDAVAPMYNEYKGTNKGQIAPELFDIVDKYNAASK